MRIPIVWGWVVLLSLNVAHAEGICPDNTAYTSIASRNYGSLAYRITDCKGHESIVLGTLHSSDPAIIASIAYVFPHLKQAKGAWFELVHQAGDEKLLATRMFLPASEKQGLKEMLGEKDFARLMQRLHTKAPNLPEAYVTRYQPWAAGVMLDTLSIDTSGVVMDDKVQQEAITEKVPVHALETMEEQFNVFETFSRAEQVSMLKEAITSFDEAETINQQLIDAYKAGDLHKIAELSASTFKEMPDPRLADKLLALLVTDRNAHMAKELLPVLKQGDAFIAIGALHLPDESGLLNRFEKAGLGVYPLK